MPGCLRRNRIEALVTAVGAVCLSIQSSFASGGATYTPGPFWIHSAARAYSSASFLIDRSGTIVWGHDLGRLEKSTAAALSLHDAIHKQLEPQRLTGYAAGSATPQGKR